MYTCAAGDTFDLIALKLYRDENMSYLLMRENPEYAGVQRFKGGEVLRVPEVETDVTLPVAPWKGV